MRVESSRTSESSMAIDDVPAFVVAFVAFAAPLARLASPLAPASSLVRRFFALMTRRPRAGRRVTVVGAQSERSVVQRVWGGAARDFFDGRVGSFVTEGWVARRRCSSRFIGSGEIGNGESRKGGGRGVGGRRRRVGGVAAQTGEVFGEVVGGGWTREVGGG